MDGGDADDPLFLQAKEAQAVGAGALRRQATVRQPGRTGRRGQRLMQAASDIFLGWQRVRASTADSGLLRPPTARLEGFGRRRRR